MKIKICKQLSLTWHSRFLVKVILFVLASTQLFDRNAKSCDFGFVFVTAMQASNPTLDQQIKTQLSWDSKLL